MLSVAEALDRILAAFSPLPAETIAIHESAGRVLAAPVVARLDQPFADLSAMDGYALRAADVPSVPATLSVVGEAPAGGSHDHALKSGEAVRIFTGGPLPSGADAIVIQEDTAEHRPGARPVVAGYPHAVTILEQPTAGRHVRRKGLDFSTGAVGIQPSKRLTARDQALAAAMNVPWLAVHRRPRVAILATGDELVMPGEPVGRNQIVSSSAIAVATLVRSWGGEPVMLGIVADRRDAVAERIAAGGQHDLLVTLGGASVGDHDLVQDSLRAQGYGIDFWKIAMRPGKPLMYAEAGHRKALGLPGNPVSTLVCALLFLKPAIEKMTGLPGTPVATTRATLGADVRANDGRQDYVRSTLLRAVDDRPTVTPHPTQDSSMLSVAARSDALLVRPPKDPARRAGDVVDIIDLANAGPDF